jgi:hypothetical protein
MLRHATGRLRCSESPLALRGALLTILAIRSSEAWTGAFAHLERRRERALPLLRALDAHYGYRSDGRAADADAVRAVESGTAAMITLPLASDLVSALAAVALESDLVLRLTRRPRRLEEGPRRNAVLGDSP